METEYLELRERFTARAEAFSETKARDERDAQMNKDFHAQRQMAAAYVDEILDQYLELQAFSQRATPLKPVEIPA